MITKTQAKYVKIDSIGSLGSYKCVVLHKRERVFLSKSIVLLRRERLLDVNLALGAILRAIWAPFGSQERN